jgi:hypothetical protein
MPEPRDLPSLREAIEEIDREILSPTCGGG